jgi:hypothetical protein
MNGYSKYEKNVYCVHHGWIPRKLADIDSGGRMICPVHRCGRHVRHKSRDNKSRKKRNKQLLGGNNEKNMSVDVKSG